MRMQGETGLSDGVRLDARLRRFNSRGFFDALNLQPGCF